MAHVGVAARETGGGALSRLRLVIVLGSLVAVAPLATDLNLPSFPGVARDFGTSVSSVQLTLTGFFAGLGLGQLLAGPVSDVLGRRRPLLVGVGAYVAVSLACAAAPSIYALAALRLLQGAAGATGIVIAFAVVRDLYAGAEAARLLSQLLLVVGVAPVVAPIFGAGLLELMAWRGLFVVLAALGVLTLAGVAVWLPETWPEARRRRGGLRELGATLGLLGRDREFVAYVLANALSGGAMYAYIAGSPFVLQDVYGVSPAEYAAVFGVNSAGLVALGQLNGLLVGRVPLLRLLRTGVVLAAAGGAALLAVVLGHAGLAALLPCLFAVVASVGLVLPNANALALHDHPEVAGAASALLGTSRFAVGAAVAPLVGLAGRGSAVPMGIAIAALTACGAASLALRAKSPHPAGR